VGRFVEHFIEGLVIPIISQNLPITVECLQGIRIASCVCARELEEDVDGTSGGNFDVIAADFIASGGVSHCTV
jgi:hypothetical protein